MIRTFRPSMVTRFIAFLIATIAAVTTFSFIAINMEPWIPIGQFLGGNVASFGFWGQIPKLGSFFVANFVAIISGSLWALCQSIEIVPALYRFAFPGEWNEPRVVELMARWRIYAYGLESFACLNRYAIYGTKTSDLIRDFWAWDIYQWNFEEVMTVVITLFFVEALVITIATLIVIGLGHAPGMFNRGR